jgi:excisionase family DNA binding protein
MPKSMSDVVKIHTAHEVGVLLGVDYKTVLNLIKRGHLRALPGLRHKRITQAELNRYLSVQSAATATIAKPQPARPAGMEPVKDRSPVSPAAKVVASLSRSKPIGTK